MTDNEGSESPRGTRPNANYKLSKQRTELSKDEELKFHYNREQRLNKAPPSVRQLYEQPAKKNRFSLIRPLVADKPRATVFFTIVLMVVMIFMMSLLGKFSGSYKLDGNKIEISAVAYEGTTIFILKKTVNSKDPYTGAVDIGISPAQQTDDNGEYSVFTHRVFFTLDEVEERRFVVPFDSPALVVVLQTEKTTLKTTVKPK